MSTAVTVRVPQTDRYELRVDDIRVGHAQVIEAGGNATIPHVEIDPAYEGRGLGTQLVRETLADLRARGLRVIARCPFVVAYLKRHPEEAG